MRGPASTMTLGIERFVEERFPLHAEIVPAAAEPSALASTPDHALSVHFQADLSASQRWPLNSLASASTEVISSFWSPSSSLLGASARLSFAPVPSSAVVMAGLLIHSIRWSDPPGLSAA